MSSIDQTLAFVNARSEWDLQSYLPMQTGSIMRTDLQPAPLAPSWIIDGNPMARSLQLGEASDGNLSFGLWDCTDGQFIFKYRSDELVHILEGEAIVRGPGMELHLHPGVVAFFPQGMTMHWTVRRYIKKLAIFRSPHRSYFDRIAGKLKRVWQRIPLSGWQRKHELNPHFAMLTSAHPDSQLVSQD